MLSRIVNYFSDKQNDDEKRIQDLIHQVEKLKRENEDLIANQAQLLRTYRLKLNILREENEDLQSSKKVPLKVRPLEEKKGKTWKKKQV